MIWSSMDMLDDEAREQYQELQREVQEDDTYTVSDAEWADVVSGSLTDERLNLDKKIEALSSRSLGGHMERTAARVPNSGQQHCRHPVLPMRRRGVVRRQLQYPGAHDTS